MRFSAFLLLTLSILFYECSNGQNSTKTNLTAVEFAEALAQKPNAPLIDVRTPEEFGGGHLANAINLNWNDNNFKQEISKFDKNNPIFVYCLSGGRSASAASSMRSMGFKEVYEMQGGMMKWKAAKLPEAAAAAKEQGMSLQAYNQLLNTQELVLVDFYAEWCQPCKKMKPYLEEIAKERATSVEVVRIDVDKNPLIANALKVEELPTLVLYKNNTVQWRNIGFIDKEGVEKQLEKK
jgi:thioredoxin 1